MILDEGEIIHVVEHPGFDTDVRRHFIGQVKRVSGMAIRAEGYTFVFNSNSGTFERKQEKRIRVISLVSGKNLINILPPETDIEATDYTVREMNRMVVTDGKNFELCINEFSAIR